MFVFLIVHIFFLLFVVLQARSNGLIFDFFIVQLFLSCNFFFFLLSFFFFVLQAKSNGLMEVTVLISGDQRRWNVPGAAFKKATEKVMNRAKALVSPAFSASNNSLHAGRYEQFTLSFFAVRAGSRYVAVFFFVSSRSFSRLFPPSPIPQTPRPFFFFFFLFSIPVCPPLIFPFFFRCISLSLLSISNVGDGAPPQRSSGTAEVIQSIPASSRCRWLLSC